MLYMRKRHTKISRERERENNMKRGKENQENGETDRRLPSPSLIDISAWKKVAQ